MKPCLKIFILLFPAFLLMSGGYAQQEILTSGSEFSGEGGSVSWSLGQVSYQVFTGTGGILTEGVQQPYEIFIMPGLEENAAKKLWLVYPNPTSYNIILKILDPKLICSSFCLYDPEGRELQKKIVVKAETIIYLDGFKPGIYFLVVRESDQVLGTYKIIKK